MMYTFVPSLLQTDISYKPSRTSISVPSSPLPLTYLSPFCALGHFMFDFYFFLLLFPSFLPMIFRIHISFIYSSSVLYSCDETALLSFHTPSPFLCIVQVIWWFCGCRSSVESSVESIVESSVESRVESSGCGGSQNGAQCQ